ncbi:MAG TPA: hypothetical protein VFE02_16755 [Candidatus Acidoferrales bacterium]|nr:hypothetical protein [Candidatus Acidoferrales bacterium]
MKSPEYRALYIWHRVKKKGPHGYRVRQALLRFISFARLARQAIVPNIRRSHDPVAFSRALANLYTQQVERSARELTEPHPAAR